MVEAQHGTVLAAFLLNLYTYSSTGVQRTDAEICRLVPAEPPPDQSWKTNELVEDFSR